MSLRRRVMGQGSGGEIVERGTVSFHTGASSKELTIPFTAELWSTDFIVEIVPVRTWAFVDDEWVERESLDFTGITGFKSGTWHPLPIYVVVAKRKSLSGGYYCRYLNQAQYSDGVSGNFNAGKVVFDSASNCLTFPNIEGYVCVADGGLTYQYTIRRWSE